MRFVLHAFNSEKRGQFYDCIVCEEELKYACAKNGTPIQRFFKNMRDFFCADELKNKFCRRRVGNKRLVLTKVFIFVSWTLVSFHLCEGVDGKSDRRDEIRRWGSGLFGSMQTMHPNKCHCVAGVEKSESSTTVDEELSDNSTISQTFACHVCKTKTYTHERNRNERTRGEIRIC